MNALLHKYQGIIFLDQQKHSLAHFARLCKPVFLLETNGKWIFVNPLPDDKRRRLVQIETYCL